MKRMDVSIATCPPTRGIRSQVRAPDHALGGALVIGGEADADVAIVEDRIVRAVGLFDLIEGLRDQYPFVHNRLKNRLNFKK